MVQEEENLERWIHSSNLDGEIEEELEWTVCTRKGKVTGGLDIEVSSTKVEVMGKSSLQLLER